MPRSPRPLDTAVPPVRLADTARRALATAASQGNPACMLRAFCNLPNRQVHYRHAGAGGRPLLMLHPSPGASRAFDAVGDALGINRQIIAPDRPGNGDSPPLPIPTPEISDYAAAEIAFLDALRIDQFDVYGMHTGACVAAERAITWPARVRRVILDGFGLFSPEESARYLAHYAPPIAPDLAGTHLPRTFQFIRDQALFFPWFDPHPENARGLGLPPPAYLHDSTLDVLKVISTYHLGYHASFRYNASARLKLIQQRTLAVTADDDPLAHHLPEALRLLPNAVTTPIPPLRSPTRAANLSRLLDTFLG